MLKLNNVPIPITMFPDNTSQVWKLPENIIESLCPVSYLLQWDYEHEGEFLQLAQLKTLLDTLTNNISILYISYLPYGRQDKEVSNESCFALNTFSKLLNTLNFDIVRIEDPHSDKVNLIKNVVINFSYDKVLSIIEKYDIDTICFPDKGAKTKYTKWFENMDQVYCDKIRDQLTGKILSLELTGNVENKNVLIVDDIIDGGGTFCLTANKLYENGAESVNLYGSHGIFSKGLTPLKKAMIDNIFTKDGKAFEYKGMICYDEYNKAWE